MVTDASDKLLVASVLERGKRDTDGDVVQPEQEDVSGAPLDFDAAAELGVQVRVEEGQEQPWQEPPAKLGEDQPSSQAELDAMAQDMVGIDDPLRMYLRLDRTTAEGAGSRLTPWNRRGSGRVHGP